MPTIGLAVRPVTRPVLPAAREYGSYAGRMITRSATLDLEQVSGRCVGCARSAALS
jgi:hypothetical protein